MLKENPDYYTELSINGKLEEVEKQIEELIIDKNDQWYNLSGFIYGLVKLGYSEEYLLSRSPIELILISSKVREIEEEIAEEQQKRQQSGSIKQTLT